MKRYILNLINEHKELVKRTNKLAAFITSCNIDSVKEEYKISLEDYALMRIQLDHMNNYRDTLSTRLNHHGIMICGNRYLEDVTDINESNPVDNKTPGPGSDFDLDKQNENIQD